MFRFFDQFLISVVNRTFKLFGSNTPRRSAPTNLMLKSSHVSPWLYLNQHFWLSLLCSSKKEFRSCSTKSYFFSAGFLSFWISFIFRVLPIRLLIICCSIISLSNRTKMRIRICDFLSINIIPILDKMAEQINDTISSYLNPNIMPRHSWLLFPINGRLGEVFGCSWCEPSQPFIRIISSIPFIIFIHDTMFRSIPSSIADVKTTHKANLLINNNWFFMVAPKLRSNRMSVHFYISI